MSKLELRKLEKNQISKWFSKFRVSYVDHLEKNLEISNFS